MRVVAKLVAGIICSAATVAWLSAQQAAPVTLFEGARLIVGDGSAPIENAAFLVETIRFRVGRQHPHLDPAASADYTYMNVPGPDKG